MVPVSFLGVLLAMADPPGCPGPNAPGDGKLCIPVTKDFHNARSKFVTKGGEKVKVRGNIVNKDGSTFLVLAEDAKK